MKIGVLTYHCPPNFGAQLQAISTVGYLKKMGHDVIVLNWYAKDLEEMYAHRIPEIQRSCHSSFASATMPLSNKCQNEEELIAEINRLKLDAIIVGSDALFKYIPLKSRRHFSFRKLKYIYHFTPLSSELLDNNPFFGGFLKQLSRPIPAAVYAASSQNCPYQIMNYWERKRMGNALSNYIFLSARDVWTRKMLQSITNTDDIPVYPDPVFSFNQNCHLLIPSKKEVKEKFRIPDNYVLLSFSKRYISEDYLNKIGEEVLKKGLIPVALPMPEILNAASIAESISLPLSPLWWYALIFHSQGYIGERMHPIVVCLHNAVPFFCFDEYGTKVPQENSKIMSYDKSSSKTYSIVNDANFLDCYYSYQTKQDLPEVHHVVEKLLSFDKNACMKYAEKKRQAYENGMNNILRLLS